MLRPLYQLLEEFPSLREKTLEKIRQIERAQEEARRSEKFPLRPIFPPPLKVVYPDLSEPVNRSEAPACPSVMSESESSTSDPMSVDSFQEAMDFSSRPDRVSDQAEVTGRASSRGDFGSQSSSDVEILEPSVAVPPPIDAIPLSAATGAEFAQRFPRGASSSAKADVDPGDDDDAESDVDVSEAAEIESTVSEFDLLAFRHLYSISPSIRLRRPLREERAYDGRDGEICLYEQMFRLGFRLPIHPIIRAILAYINLAPSQLSPNAWRLIIGAIVLWRAVHHSDLPVQVFTGCYVPSSAKNHPSYYHFVARKQNKKMLQVTQTSNHNWKPRYFFASGAWEFGPSVPPSSLEPRIPLRWGKVTMAAKDDPGLSQHNLQKVKDLQDQGEHGLLVRYEHLMTPYYLSETGLGGSPLTELRKLPYFFLQVITLNLCATDLLTQTFLFRRAPSRNIERNLGDGSPQSHEAYKEGRYECASSPSLYLRG